MNERTLNKDLPSVIGKIVSIAGWVDVRRDHGKLIFLDMRDRSGIVQVVATPKAAEALETAKTLRAQWVVEIEGEVKERPENMRTEDVLGGIELVASSIRILSPAQELPFEVDTEVNIDTRFDYLPLTLRSRRSRDIFTMEATILEAYRKSLRTQEFVEFQAPALVGGDAEGGAAAFKVAYYDEHTAFLATSPQFYKEIMVGPFERAFTQSTGESVPEAEIAFWNGHRFWTTIGPFLTTQTALWMIVTLVGVYAIVRRRQQRAAQRKRWEEQGFD